MKYILMTAMVALSLSACSDPSNQPAASAGDTAAAAPAAPVPAAPAPAAPTGVVYTKAEATRPVTLPAQLAAVASCGFDRLNGGERTVSNTIGDKSRVSMNGWAADLKATVPPGPLFIEFDGPVKLYVAAQRSLKRPDVVSAHNNPVLIDSGWEANFDMSAAMPGQYKVQLIEVNGAGATTCDPNAVFVIAG